MRMVPFKKKTIGWVHNLEMASIIINSHTYNTQLLHINIYKFYSEYFSIKLISTRLFENKKMGYFGI